MLITRNAKAFFVLIAMFGPGCGDGGGSPSSFDAQPSSDAQSSSDASVPDASMADAAPAPTQLYTAAPNGDIYELDPTTGAATLAIDTQILGDGDEMVDLGKISSIARRADGRVWLGSAGTNPNCDSCLFELDIATGIATVVAETNLRAVPGLAITDDDQIFTMQGDGSALYSISSTGTPTEIIDDIDPKFSNYQGNSLTPTTDGELLISSNGALYTIDVTTLSSTVHGISDFQGFDASLDTSNYYVVALATGGDGTYWGILKKTGGTSTENSHLVTITVTGAVVTNVGELDARYDGLIAEAL